MDAKTLQRIKELNQQPVQQLAMKALKEMKVGIDPTSLHSTQLIVMALELGEHDLDEAAEEEAEQMLDRVLAGGSVAVEARLVQEGQETSVPVEELQEAPPRRVATEFLLGAQREFDSLQPSET